MLTVTRKEGQAVIIAPNPECTRVTVSTVDGDCVRLTIEAPTEVEVHREEIWKQREAQRAEQERRDLEWAANAAAGVPDGVSLSERSQLLEDEPFDGLGPGDGGGYPHLRDTNDGGPGHA